jgi:hypothetical protein
MREIEVERGILATEYFALYVENLSAVVVADLHLGFEDAMADKGLFLPKMQREHIFRLLDACISRYSPRKLIVVGDLKHEFSRNVRGEWRDVEEFLERYGHMEILVIRGNHDNFLKTILSRHGIDLLTEYEEGGITFAHGHKTVEWDGLLVMGHEHPSVALRDHVGGSIKLPAYLHLPSRIVVLPSMSFYSSGSDIVYGEILSPVLRRVGVESMDAYPISEELGVFHLGTVRDIRAASLP